MRCPECGKLLRRSAIGEKVAFVCIGCDYSTAKVGSTGSKA